MKQFKLVNNLFGWITFAIAAFTYCSTIEPSASFWDCPEFITTAYKFEVGHPPGAPFFMLTANLFTQLASDPSQVAKMVNIMSALLSATCILFLFWSITHLTRRLLCKTDNEMTTSKMVTIIGSGLVGALAYTFSDTFWFSAVEGEVYAYSSMFTAVVFWLILKWEEHADEPHSDRWLILIAYLTGLSIGVHLLNLLCIPAIVLVYYYKKCPHANLKGSLLTLIGSFAIVVAVLYGIVPGIVKMGGYFELFFVNDLGFSFNTGFIIYIITLLACVIWGVAESYLCKSRLRSQISFILSICLMGIPFYGYGMTSVICAILVIAALIVALRRKEGSRKNYLVSYRLMNTTLLCGLFILMGYASYAVIVIRSVANPPMDQNSPEDVFTLGEYLNREQYGTRPLFYGQAYTSKLALRRENGYCVPESVKGAPVYQRKEKKSENEKDAYEIVRYKTDYKYAQNMLFPRMYSDDSNHVNAYESWMGGVKGYTVPYDECGQMTEVKMPTQWENLRFFISYQLNFMYWRYFMWNFVGRENDLQGNGEPENGNWITGIDFIDSMILGADVSQLPDNLKQNKGHNVFYALPLILGLLGLFWQAYRKGNRGVQQFWVVFFLFFMTGIAIVIYLNQTPMQPRERDYAYAGSFYAFAIWIGMGVAAIAELLEKAKMNKTAAAALATLGCLCVPIQMVSQTWDDHDRSNRFACRDFGENYLMSLQEKGNPVIFTCGDNDTFPLWYNQETEGNRTDARVCNLSYLQTDWYIDQMKRPAYDSPSLPIDWKRWQYVGGVNEYVRIQPGTLKEAQDYFQDRPDEFKANFGENPYELKNIMKHWVLADDSNLHFIPTDSIVITIDKEAVKRSGMMIADDSIPEVMHVSLKGKKALYKSELMMLEMLANCNWERPLYVATTVSESNYMNLGDNFVQEGLANRITPFNTKNSGMNIDANKMYDNMMNKFKYGNVSDPNVYLDETVTRMTWTHRRTFAALIKQLIKEGDIARAKKALDYSAKVLPYSTILPDFMSGSIDMALCYAAVGNKKQAEYLLDAVAKRSIQYLNFYLTEKNFNTVAQNSSQQLYILSKVAETMQTVDVKKAADYQNQLNQLYQAITIKGGIH